MTDSQIMLAATNKAVAGGWDVFGHPHGLIQVEYPLVYVYTSDEEDKKPIATYHARDILLNNYFLRAFFGTKPLYDDKGNPNVEDINGNRGEEWEHHKDQINASIDPIKYIEAFV